MTTNSENVETPVTHRVSFDCDEQLLSRVKRYRHSAPHDTLTKAYAALWELGLEAARKADTADT